MAELAYAELRRAIIEHRIGPGERLDIDEIGASLGFSRAPVNDALKLLQADGFVVSKRRVGTFASLISPTHIREIFEAREMLEQWNAPGIVANVNNREVETLAGLLADARALVEDERESRFDYRRFMQLDHEFHAAIMKLADRELFAHWFDGLSAHMQRVRWTFRGGALVRSREGQTEHEAILDGIRARDVKRLRRALAEHTRRSLANALGIAQAASVE